jgi:hypothetical protein
MKTYPSARSLVAAVDADALVDALGGALGDLGDLGEDAPEAPAPTTPAPAPIPPPEARPTPVAVAPPPEPPPPPPQEAKKPANTPREMRDCFSLGDYTGALDVAEKILEQDPNDQEALRMANDCRSTLEKMYTSKIGPLTRVPTVMVPSGELRWLSIDHRAGFVLSNIDGVSSLEMIIDVSGMPTLDALRILCELAQQRIISFK